MDEMPSACGIAWLDSGTPKGVCHGHARDWDLTKCAYGISRNNANARGVVSGGFPRGRALGERRVPHPMRLPHESVPFYTTALR
eukprot:631650-Prymnesium_polylepis.1